MRTRAKPRVTRKRRFLPADNPVWLLKTQVKLETWKLIDRLAGGYGMGAGIDKIAELLLQREREIAMLTEMLRDNLPKGGTAKVELSTGRHSVELTEYKA